jgi:hypothetical protein
VRRESRKQCFGAVAAEKKICNRIRGRKGRESKSCEQERVTRKNVNGLQHFVRKRLPAPDEGFHKADPRFAIPPQSIAGCGEIAIEQYGRAVIQRVR